MYYIYQLRQIGNIGANEIFAIEEQPTQGFYEYEYAEHYLHQSISERKIYPFNNRGRYVILKTYNSK